MSVVVGQRTSELIRQVARIDAAVLKDPHCNRSSPAEHCAKDVFAADIAGIAARGLCENPTNHCR